MSFRTLELLVINLITSIVAFPLIAMKEVPLSPSMSSSQMEDISTRESVLLDKFLNGKPGDEMKEHQQIITAPKPLRRIQSQTNYLYCLCNATESLTVDETIAQALKEHALIKALRALQKAPDITTSGYKLLTLLINNHQTALLKKLLLTKEYYCLIYKTIQQLVAKNDYTCIQHLKNHGLSGDWRDESKTPSLLETAYARYKKATNKNDCLPMLRCIISTPASLQSFVEANDYEAVSLFMSLGASPLQTTTHGTTLIECAKQHYFYEMAGLLYSHKKT